MVEELFGTSEINAKGGKVSPATAFAGKKVICIYFSMHNCPPCRQFTPVFADLYSELEESGNNEIGVIFCSGDKDEAVYNDYYGEMPWHALPFKDARMATLAKKFDVRGVPRLVVLKASNGEVINQNAVQKVMMEGPSAIEEFLSAAK